MGVRHFEFSFKQVNYENPLLIYKVLINSENLVGISYISWLDFTVEVSDKGSYY